METLRLVIYCNKSVYDDLLVSSLFVTEHKNHHLDNDGKSREINSRNAPKRLFFIAPNYLNKDVNSYAVSAYIHALKHSNFYRQCALRPLLNYSKDKIPSDAFPVIMMKLRSPQKQFLDYKWGERMTQMALERCEVDLAMSWLSTLGGAFSALGEHYQHCAQMAGKISIHQFKLALRLGDPLLEARCKLYAALSMIQQGNLRIPRFMIKDIFKFAVDHKDAHLQRMCQGVWAKLKYCYKLRRQKK